MEREVKCLCGEVFLIPIKRGRPAVRCGECREAYANGTLRDRLASKGIDPYRPSPSRINSDPTSTPQDEINKPQIEDETEISKKRREANELVDRLEEKLRVAGNHISQHRDKW